MMDVSRRSKLGFTLETLLPESAISKCNSISTSPCTHGCAAAADLSAWVSPRRKGHCEHGRKPEGVPIRNAHCDEFSKELEDTHEDERMASGKEKY
jgi:hypothetical protein